MKVLYVTNQGATCVPGSIAMISLLPPAYLLVRRPRFQQQSESKSWNKNKNK